MTELPKSDEYTAAVERFAAELRTLRVSTNNLTLDGLASRSQISRSVIAAAMRGKQLPSGRTVAAIARACGADPSPYLARRDEIEHMRDGASSTGSRKNMPRRVPWWWLPLSAAAAAALAVTVTLLVINRQDISEPAETAVASGQNAATTVCIKDAKVVAKEIREEWYSLEIVYSDSCQAGWGRVTRFDDASAGNLISVQTFPQDSPTGTLLQTATEHDVASAYTNLLIRPTPQTLICADGSVSVDGRKIDLGPPLCT